MTEREYDNIYNEGSADGYNPIREARLKTEREAEIAMPKSIEEQKEVILRQIAIHDCSIAKESGTYDQAKIDNLRAQLKDLEDRDNAKFIIDWPLELTKKRRAGWNEMIQAGKLTGSNGKVSNAALRAAERAQGWTLSDLKRAIKIHKQKAREIEGYSFTGSYSYDKEEMKAEAAKLRKEGWKAIVVHVPPNSRGHGGMGYSVYFKTTPKKLIELENARKAKMLDLEEIGGLLKMSKLELAYEIMRRNHKKII